MSRDRDAHKRISGANPCGNYLTICIRLKTIAQEGSIALIDFLEAHDRRSSIGEGFGREGLWGQDRQCGGISSAGTSYSGDQANSEVKSLAIRRPRASVAHLAA